ncbi:MAG: hypothetical protein IKB20_01120 [Clostridia bacterium]|nr:hypothetical protein [Clostridia bacterium]
MAVFPPIPMIRKNAIVRKLKKYGAVSPETAKTLAEIGLVNPNGFKRITQKLIQKGVICQADDGKYFKEV